MAANAEFSTHTLNREAKREIQKVFRNLPGSHYDLVLEKSLLNCLEVVCGMNFLKVCWLYSFRHSFIPV
jgi:hypothetical protein